MYYVCVVGVSEYDSILVCILDKQTIDYYNIIFTIYRIIIIKTNYNIVFKFQL
jgi:hypothetical protein